MALKLTVGSWYCIKAIRSTFGTHYRHKLLAMGFLPGAWFLVKRIAPWGGPILLQINESTISLRYEELVELLQLEQKTCP